MWIQVRSMDGRKSIRMDGLSKLSKIEDLRVKLVEEFDAPVERQRLFYRGKQLEDGHTLFDYNVGLNEIVQILVRPISDSSSKNKETNEENSFESSKEKIAVNKENESLEDKPNSNCVNLCLSSHYYKVGDLIDGKDATYGAWFEAKIVGIKINPSGVNVLAENVKGINKSLSKESDVETDNLLYSVLFEEYEVVEGVVELTINCIRPRARKILKFDDVQVGDLVMVNYNIEEPKKRGYWYDCKVTDKKSMKTQKELLVTIFIGPEKEMLESCKICFTDEIFAIEKRVCLLDANDKQPEESSASRQKTPQCVHCKDIPTRKCKICSCNNCGGKDDPGKQIICDECDLSYHIWCLNPPLTAIPDTDEWYCPKCKNDETEVVRAGEKLKVSKKKSKMASANSTTSRDWGKGMACVGRTKECTIVPPNHFGPVPGVEVGTLWKFRVQVSESGTHRPHVAGIHGRESEGAYSIVLSGGYEDDLDEGEEFKYTGSGGRDLSGNKRCADQSCDQTLTRMNKALALNCAVPINSKKGAEASDWKKGKPVRVVRNCKGKKHSDFSPEEGNRYDGIYKVVKYWPEKGKSGYLVWRYLLRRDDPIPAPWTKEGKKRTQKLGLAMQYPEGYLESQAEKERQKAEDADEKKPTKKRMNLADELPTPKKKRSIDYKIPADVEELMKNDVDNEKVWEECRESLSDGCQAFMKKVETSFLCICCQEVAFQPITTKCLHNICKTCLQRSFKAEVYTCPMCRYELGKGYSFKINDNLQKILLKFFPGYDARR